jgi:5'-3' exonuclease
VPEPLLLLDAASLYFRAYFGIPQSMTAPDGTPVNAVRGLLDFVARLVGQYRPGRLVAAMDADWRPQFRVDAIASYKAHRVGVADGEDVPEPLAAQVPIIEQVLDALGLARVGVPGFEADDVIGTLAARDPGPVDVVTGDRDLFQVVDDSRGVRVLYTARGVGRHEIVDEAEVTRRYGIPGRAYADFAVLRGDPSDGLPGVAGIGEKTAAGLITRWGSLAALVAALDAGDPAVAARPRLAAAREYLAVAPAVVRVRTDVPLPDYAERLPATPADPERLLELSDRWALDGAVNRVLNALATAARDRPAPGSRGSGQPSDE